MTRPTTMLLAVLLIVLSPGDGIAEDPPGREFTGMAIMDTTQGTRRMPFTLVVSRFTPLEEAEEHKALLESGGQSALLGALKGRSGGRLRLGALEWSLGLVVAESLGRDGYRYFVVTARRVQYEEIEQSSESLDYPFGVAVFEMGRFGSGEGKLYPAAALAVAEDGTVTVEQYEIDPGRVTEIKKVR